MPNINVKVNNEVFEKLCGYSDQLRSKGIETNLSDIAREAFREYIERKEIKK